MMTEYEVFYVVGESKEAELDSIKKEVQEIVEKEGGVFTEAEFVEKRKLAYPVRREIRGTYIAKRFSLPGKDERNGNEPDENPVSSMTRTLNLYPKVLRFIIVRAEELPSLSKEEGSAKVVEEVVKEARVRKTAVEKKSPAKVKAVEKSEEPIAEVKKEEAKPKKAKKAEAENDDLDKKLEEVLNI